MGVGQKHPGTPSGTQNEKRVSKGKIAKGDEIHLSLIGFSDTGNANTELVFVPEFLLTLHGPRV